MIFGTHTECRSNNYDKAGSTYTLASTGKPVPLSSIPFCRPTMPNSVSQQPFYYHPDTAHLNNEPKQYQDSDGGIPMATSDVE